MKKLVRLRGYEAPTVGVPGSGFHVTPSPALPVGATAPSGPRLAFERYAWDVYWPQVSERWAPHTRIEGRRLLEELVEAFGPYDLGSIRPAQVSQWWARTVGKGRNRTSNMLLQRLRHMFRHAMGLELVDRDPTLHLRRVREKTRSIRPLTPAERTALLERANPRLRLYILVARYTAGRRRSLRTLREGDIRLPAPCEDHHEADLGCGRCDPGWVIFRDTKNGEDVEVPMTRELAAAIRPLLSGNPDNDLLYPYRRLNSITQAFRRLCRRLGIQGVTFHGLRHDTATDWLEAGVDSRVVQGLLGHKTPAMTARYAKVLAGRKRRALAQWQQASANGH